MELAVAGTIDDPWDTGEALGWPKLVGTLSYDGPDTAGSLSLDTPIVWKGVSHDRFYVSRRRHGSQWWDVHAVGGLHCNGRSVSEEGSLSLIVTLKAR